MSCTTHGLVLKLKSESVQVFRVISGSDQSCQLQSNPIRCSSFLLVPAPHRRSTLTGTVISLFFGQVLNLLTRRLGEVFRDGEFISNRPLARVLRRILGDTAATEKERKEEEEQKALSPAQRFRLAAMRVLIYGVFLGGFAYIVRKEFMPHEKKN